MEITEGEEFRVESYWDVGISPNVYLRVDSISSDNYVSFSNDSTQLGFDIPVERVEKAVEQGIIVPSERSSEMHD